MAESNEVECNDAEAETAQGARLPVQLNRLPASHLRQIHEALTQIKEAGLSEIKDLDDLLQSVGQKTGLNRERLPPESLTSEYMAMNMWAWTRNRWNSGVSTVKVEPQAPVVGSSDNAAAANDDAFDTSKAMQNFEKRLKTYAKYNEKKVASCRENMTAVEEHSRAWLALMKKNSEEIQAFSSMDALPKVVGDGSGCLFEQQDKAGAHFDFTKVAARTKKAPVTIESPSSGPVSSKKRGYITVHLGQEGCGTGLAYWRKLLCEHSLGADGRPESSGGPRGVSNIHFEESSTGRFVPRCVFADFGGSQALAAVREAGFFAPVDMLEGSETSNPWEFWSKKPALSDDAMEAIRRQSEMLDANMGFLLTGSTLEAGSVVLTHHACLGLSDWAGKVVKGGHFAVPGGDLGEEERPMQLFSAAASLGGHLMEHMDVVNFYDDKALKAVASRQMNGLGLSSPSPADCHGLVARSLAAISAPTRFGVNGIPDLSTDLRSIATNLVPYPRIHFFLPSLGGIVSPAMGEFQAAGDGLLPVSSCMTNGFLSSVDIKADGAKCMAMSLICRKVEHCTAVSAVMERKSQRDCQIVDWSPGATMLANHADESLEAGEVAGFHNHSAVAAHFERWSGAQELFGNSVPDWCTMEHHETLEFFEELTAVKRDYVEVVAETQEGEGEEEEND